MARNLIALAVHEPPGCTVEDADVTPASARPNAGRLAERPDGVLSQVGSSATVRTAPSRFLRSAARQELPATPLL